jgi:hypothetical protein
MQADHGDDDGGDGGGAVFDMDAASARLNEIYERMNEVRARTAARVCVCLRACARACVRARVHVCVCVHVVAAVPLWQVARQARRPITIIPRARPTPPRTPRGRAAPRPGRRVHRRVAREQDPARPRVQHSHAAAADEQLQRRLAHAHQVGGGVCAVVRARGFCWLVRS